MTGKGRTVSFSKADNVYINKLIKKGAFTGLSDVVRSAIRCLQRERGETETPG